MICPFIIFYFNSWHAFKHIHLQVKVLPTDQLTARKKDNTQDYSALNASYARILRNENEYSCAGEQRE